MRGREGGGNWIGRKEATGAQRGLIKLAALNVRILVDKDVNGNNTFNW